MTPQLPFTESDRALIRTLRRDLHAHPELSWKEVQTQERLERALRDVGVSDIQRVARTGLVARIRGSGSGATVAIRGDIDALPIAESTGLPYASQNAGVMHACGHDMRLRRVPPPAAAPPARRPQRARARCSNPVRLMTHGRFSEGTLTDGSTSGTSSRNPARWLHRQTHSPSRSVAAADMVRARTSHSTRSSVLVR